jgi:hypothetical protein
MALVTVGPLTKPWGLAKTRIGEKAVTRALALTVVCTLLVLGIACASQAQPDNGTPISAPTPTPYVKRYTDSTLGFAVEYPSNWEFYDLVHEPCTGDPSRLCDAINFQASDDFGNYYGVTVLRYWPAVGQTVTDTVEYGLRNLTPSSREQIKSRCCLAIGGELAMEVTFPPLPEDHYRDRRLSTIYDGGEYWLVFWWNVPFQPGGVFNIPEGSEAEAAFDTFLRSFTFIPILETPTPPPPVPTPAPTPTGTPTPIH